MMKTLDVFDGTVTQIVNGVAHLKLRSRKHDFVREGTCSVEKLRKSKIGEGDRFLVTVKEQDNGEVKTMYSLFRRKKK